MRQSKTTGAVILVIIVVLAAAVWTMRQTPGRLDDGAFIQTPVNRSDALDNTVSEFEQK